MDTYWEAMMAQRLGEPRWLEDGDPEDDSWMDDQRRMCLDHGDLFFKDSANGFPDPVAYVQARQLCFHCPLFEECARWSLAHFEWVPYGVLAGLSRTERKHIDEKLDYFKDWRKNWNRAVYVQAKVGAFNRQLRQQGVSKRELNRQDLPECPRGHTWVVRAGRNHEDKPRFRCRVCRVHFCGEECDEQGLPSVQPG